MWSTTPAGHWFVFFFIFFFNLFFNIYVRSTILLINESYNLSIILSNSKSPVILSSLDLIYRFYCDLYRHFYSIHAHWKTKKKCIRSVHDRNVFKRMQRNKCIWNKYISISINATHRSWILTRFNANVCNFVQTHANWFDAFDIGKSQFANLY